MYIIEKHLAGAIVSIDKDAHLRRLIAARGGNVLTYEDRFINSGLAAADAPLGWTVTLTETGGGESTITKPDGVDGGLLFTTDAFENDGISAQLKGESFKLNANCRALYFYAKFRASEATQIDWLIGLCITDTDLLGGLSDGIYFEKLDGGTGVSCVTEKNSTETQTDAIHTFAAATDVEVEFYYDADEAAVEFFVDGVSKAKHTTNIVDDEDLTPSVEVLAGDANARTLTLKHLRVIQIGY